MIVEGRITDESIKSKLAVDEYGLFRDKNFCDTCGHQFSDICGGCETLNGVPVKYEEKQKEVTDEGLICITEEEYNTMSKAMLIAMYLKDIQNLLGEFEV